MSPAFVSLYNAVGSALLREDLGEELHAQLSSALALADSETGRRQPAVCEPRTVTVVHAPNGTGLNWFVDVLRDGGWDNHASFRTADAAHEYARTLRGRTV